jgi:trigger factor
MPVQVQQESIDHCRVALTIEVPPDEIRKAMDSVFSQVAKRTNVPGFRPGKAPVHLLKRFIDEDRVRDLAVERALTNAYNDALKQTGVAPYREAEPQVEMPEEDLDLDKGFSFKATVPLQPHVHLGDLEGLSARRVSTPVAEEDVTREIDRFREAAGTYQPTDQPAQDGDRVRGTVDVTVEGAPVPEASFTEPALMQIGANLDEFDAGLKGLTAGGEKSFDFAYPDDFANEDLRGKTATARVKAIEVLRRVTPEADDEFAQKLEMDNLEALKNRIREMLQGQSDAMADAQVDDDLVKEVVRRSTVHYPEEMVEREVSARMDSLIRALERRSLTLNDYLAAEQTDLAALQELMREEARDSIVTTLVLLEVAHQNELRVADKDVEEEVKRRAEAENVKPAHMRRLLNDSGETEAIRNRIFFRKVADALRSKAEIREV